MPFATLLNGYALNSTIRLTFSESETIVGEALATGVEPTRIVFGTGSAHSQAIGTGVGTRSAYMSPTVCGGEAVTPSVDAWRVMKVEASGISSGATSTGSFTRLAFGVSQPLSGTATAKPFEPVRLARPITQPQVKDQTLNGMMLGESTWHDGRSDAFADSTLESQILATHLVTPVTVSMVGTASINPLAYDLTRWMTPRPMRSRAISYVKEGLIFTLKVNQQYATGTAIARSSSRGTPNTLLAFSITYADADMRLAQSAVKVARDGVPGRIVAQAQASGVTKQNHSIQGAAVATATSDIAPDITQAADGIRYAYVQGKQTGIASLSVATAVRWPMVRGVRQPASAALSVTQLIARDMGGKALAYGASLTDPLEALVTHTVWMEGRGTGAAASLSFEPTVLRKAAGKAEAVCATTGVPWYWVAVAADGVAHAKAEAWGANPRIYTDGAGTTLAEAHLSATGFKVAYVSGRADAGGATLGEAANVTRHMRSAQVAGSATAKSFYPKVTRTLRPIQVVGTASSQGGYRNAAIHADPQRLVSNATVYLPWAPVDAATGARPLRWTLLTEVGTAFAQAGASRNVFKINADDPAPLQRVLDVPFADRRHLLTASVREYSVR